MTDSPASVVDALLIGETPAVRRVKELILQVAPTRVPVMIEGETGTGKELVAEALHAVSGRRGDFVAFNVCAIAESMFEDALFGHVKGGYTGAICDSAGYLVEADMGTLFLDEIVGLPLRLQAKFLRAVEQRVFRAVGAKRDSRSDFRVVSAANRPFGPLVRDGGLRLDLAHRLRGVVVQLPPLRERLRDIPLLAAQFVSRMERTDGRRASISPSAISVLTVYRWPGNVRELRHVVESAAVLSHHGVIDGTAVTELIRGSASSAANGNELVARASAKARLVAAILVEGGNRRAAARSLGIGRATLYRHMHELGIDLCELQRQPASVDTP